MKQRKEKQPHGAHNLSKNGQAECSQPMRSTIQVEGRQASGMLNKEILSELQVVRLEDVSREDLVDLKDVVLDRSLGYRERLEDFVRQVKNPYLFRVGPMVVKIGPGGTGDFREALARGIVMS